MSHDVESTPTFLPCMPCGLQALLPQHCSGAGVDSRDLRVPSFCHSVDQLNVLCIAQKLYPGETQPIALLIRKHCTKTCEWLLLFCGAYGDFNRYSSYMPELAADCLHLPAWHHAQQMYSHDPRRYADLCKCDAVYAYST